MSDVRVSVNLPKNVVVSLKQMAKAKGITMTEVLRKAILTEELLQEEVEQGNKILIEKQDKSFRQIMFR